MSQHLTVQNIVLKDKRKTAYSANNDNDFTTIISSSSSPNVAPPPNFLTSFSPPQSPSASFFSSRVGGWVGGREGKKEVLIFGFRKEPGVKEKNTLPKMEIDFRMNYPEVRLRYLL